jgi:hypothetical protein
MRKNHHHNTKFDISKAKTLRQLQSFSIYPYDLVMPMHVQSEIIFRSEIIVPNNKLFTPCIECFFFHLVVGVEESIVNHSCKT